MPQLRMSMAMVHLQACDRKLGEEVTTDDWEVLLVTGESDVLCIVDLTKAKGCQMRRGLVSMIRVTPAGTYDKAGVRRKVRRKVG